MAQYNFAQELATQSGQAGSFRTEYTMIQPTSVMTGDKDHKRFLLYQLKLSMMQAQKIDMIVSFLMESGVRMLLKDLKAAISRGVRIRILTGNYLGITQPSALYLIKQELGSLVDLRFYNEPDRSFHPKSYIFHYADKSEIFIGSSNLSRSALTSGIEWNYRFSSEADPANFQIFYHTFEDLFFHHSILINNEELQRYSKNWHKPAVARDLAKYDNTDEEEHAKTEALFQPRGAQIEALYALEQSRAQGAAKGLVQAATGIGKTYLAAFDSVKYKRVLFVAHREEILKQAALSFQNVRKSEDYGYFYGKKKETDKSVIFASPATLGRKEYLNDNYFAKDYFDYIVIDEFHHAVNQSYRQIVHYFTPKFLLGLTATPERMDGRNIYEICDYHVPYEISLKEAINKGLLVPFHYYGIYDETDYSGLRLYQGHYNENELTAVYQNNKTRYDLIYKYYMKYRSSRALGFCCSRIHAELMAKEFCKRGIPSAAVYSNADSAYAQNRDEAVRMLKKKEIRVIFSVDMFNEGLDIASLDMVMFLRPTESPVVFLQQLGRGLRTYKGKAYLTVLDFIGNYEKAGNAPMLLGGENTRSDKKPYAYQEIEYPDDCQVDFDMRLIDLFRELDKRATSVKERIQKEFYRVKELLNGKIPTRMELFSYMDDEVYQYCMKHAKENPFRKYLEFLHSLEKLSKEEGILYAGIGREFLSLLETTDMQKVYKMPILYSFYHNGDIRRAVTDNDILDEWKKFFDTDLNWRDLSDGISYEEYKQITDQQHLRKAKTMPVRFLKASGKGFFIEKEGCAIAICDDLKEIIRLPALIAHMKDILEYRTMEYYRRRYAER